MGSYSAPGGLQSKCKPDFPDGGEAGQVDGEGAVVLLGELSPTHLGNFDWLVLYLFLAGSKVGQGRTCGRKGQSVPG